MHLCQINDAGLLQCRGIPVITASYLKVLTQRCGQIGVRLDVTTALGLLRPESVFVDIDHRRGVDLASFKKPQGSALAALAALAARIYCLACFSGRRPPPPSLRGFYSVTVLGSGPVRSVPVQLYTHGSDRAGHQQAAGAR
ncbi:hypothetical protein AOLI_G00141930 [Acnodon oligacanthus]